MWLAGDGVCGYGGDEAPFFVDGELVMNICGRKNANFKDLTPIAHIIQANHD